MTHRRCWDQGIRYTAVYVGCYVGLYKTRCYVDIVCICDVYAAYIKAHFIRWLILGMVILKLIYAGCI